MWQFLDFCNAKIQFLLPMALWPMSWPWPPGFLPSVTPISCCCTALLHIEQFGGILLNNLVASFWTMWWHPSEQFGGILLNNVVASFWTIWWHSSEQCGGILLNNVVASFWTMWWHSSEQCGGILLQSVFPSIPYLSSKLPSSKTSFPKFIFEFCVENSYCLASPL